MKAFWQLWGKTPNPPPLTQSFIAGHDNTFCRKPFGQHRSPLKNLQPALCGGRRQGRHREQKPWQNSPAKTQNLSNLRTSTKGNCLQPSQTQHKLSGQTKMCLQQPLSGWVWSLDRQISNSFQQSEHKPIASKSIPSLGKGGDSRWCPQTSWSDL